MHRPAAWQPESLILAIDDESYVQMGGVGNLRETLARSLNLLAAVKPKLVAIDVILADKGDEVQNGHLAMALHNAGTVILPCELSNGKWEDPIAIFSEQARAIGHVHANPDAVDGVTRHVPLERVAGIVRRWSLGFEAYLKARNVRQLEESPNDLDADGIRIPVARVNNGRSLRIRFLPPAENGASAIPQLTLKQLLDDPSKAAMARDKVVFVGATSQSTSRDRYMTPYTMLIPMPGVEIHAQLYEMLANQRFLTDYRMHSGVFLGLLLAIGAGATFYLLSGWPAYFCGLGIIAIAHVVPHVFFLNGIVFPYFAPVVIAWLSVATAATFAHFLTRRQLRTSESEKSRYQEAIHFVAHEMRSPLTAIQGSSELMSRYNMNDDKRKQMAQMINSESKRLGKMIQTFLDVERLSDGQMQLKKEPFDMRTILDSCLARVAPLAERKQIEVTSEAAPAVQLVGDHELMEYAVYNLLNNAIKYSPGETHVRVGSSHEGSVLRLSVKDEGIGMDEKELKQIFTKFYRTKKAQASGEAGTGIGLSIVQQIVTHHGGKMEVTSEPGRGSCFTMILPCEEIETCNAS